MALGFNRKALFYSGNHLVISAAITHHCEQVGFDIRKETGSNVAIRSKPDAVALHTEFR